MDPDGGPEALQNKVQYDIRYYFARRANENIDKFTKSTFQLNTHAATGLKFITKVCDEKTKNHVFDSENITSACMPEIRGSKFCPVSSYMKYTTKLNPLITDLWQYPKKEHDCKDADIWYQARKIGPNPLASFMSRMSHQADLSKVYTNHSIRVTATTHLNRNKFSAKQIMAITGHKSLNSLAIYQKVSTDEKLSMAYATAVYMHSENPYSIYGPPANNPQNAEIQQGQPLQLLNMNNNTSLVPRRQATATVTSNAVPQEENEDPFENAEIPDFDLNKMLEMIENEERQENTIAMTQTSGSTTTTSVMQRQIVNKSSPKIPIFNNCKIGNINIIVKK